MTIPLSVLDLSPVGVGVAPSQAVRDSVALAATAEALGYARYWVAEHHNMASIATSAPEVLIAAIAATTTRIRVGAGGIMIPNHTPLRVVEIFRTLEALYPGRIDLGLGRAPGTDPTTSAALRRSDEPEVNHLLAELLAFEQGGFPARHPFAAITAMPSDVRIGAMWMLGSTLAGATIAAQLGLRYAFAGHFAMRQAADAIAHYRRAFQPSASLAAPYAMLAVTCVCGADDADAQDQAAPIRLAIVKTRTGKREPIATIADALAYRFSPAEQAIADDFLLGAVIGGPATVATRLRALAAEVGADELMLSTLVPSLATRQAMLARVATAMR
ncbi:MAG: LLM class flavin-dependent oxidoreductase [Kofleriaceae bacterium]